MIEQGFSDLGPPARTPSVPLASSTEALIGASTLARHGTAARRIGSLAATALFIVFASTAWLQPAPARAQSDAVRTEKPTLTATGTGSVVAVPDRVRIDIGVTTEAKTAAEALAENSRAVAALIAEAQAAGVERRAIATARLSIRPVTAQRKNAGRETSEVVGYAVTNALDIRIAPLERAGPLLDRLVSRGANTVENIDFEVSDEDKRRDGARTEAVKAARAKAELLAAAAGVRLGRILEIREGGAPAPRPVMAARVRSFAAAPIEAGETAIEAQVSITWELQE